MDLDTFMCYSSFVTLENIARDKSSETSPVLSRNVIILIFSLDGSYLQVLH